MFAIEVVEFLHKPLRFKYHRTKNLWLQNDNSLSINIGKELKLFESEVLAEKYIKKYKQQCDFRTWNVRYV